MKARFLTTEPVEFFFRRAFFGNFMSPSIDGLKKRAQARRFIVIESPSILSPSIYSPSPKKKEIDGLKKRAQARRFQKPVQFQARFFDELQSSLIDGLFEKKKARRFFFDGLQI